MFGNLDQFVRGNLQLNLDGTSSLTEIELQVAAVTLLREAASCDGEFGATDLARICTCMLREFGLREEETGELIEISNFLCQQPGKIAEFIAALRNELSADQRIIVLALVWRVLIADHQIQANEAAYGVRIRQDLDLTPEQAMQARSLAESGQLEMPTVMSDDE